MKRIRLLITALLFSITSAASFAQSSPTLHSPVHIQHQDMDITVSDWNWLRNKRKISVGITPQEQTPFRVDYDDEHYEGVSADIIAMVAQLLGIEVQLTTFKDRKEALAALNEGSIDMLENHNVTGGNVSELLFSRPYLTDRLAIFRRVNDDRALPKNLAGLKVAVLRQHVKTLQKRFPLAHLVRYDDHDNAIAAVSFGRADAYIDDMVSAYYRINRSYYSVVKFERSLSSADAGHHGFVFHPNNQRLHQLVNLALDSIGKERIDRVLKRWIGSGLIPTDEKINLTANEARWIEHHPTVRLVINDGLAPVAFFDAEGTFSGVASDLFDMITLRTGLKFEVMTHTGGINEKLASLEKHKADLTILMSDDEEEHESLRLSRALIRAPYVLVTRTNDAGKTLSVGNLAGKRIAMPVGHISEKRVRQAFPDSTLIQTSTAQAALNSVHRGEAKAAVISLPIARYYTARLFNGYLGIADSLQLGNNTTQFVMRNSDSELESIINKVLIDLPPDEMNALTNRWRTLPSMSGQTWRNYEQMILEIILVSALLLLMALIWVFYLRRQVKARLRAEKALKDQLQFIETLTDSMPPPLYVRDIEGRLLSCNRSYLDYLGISTEQAMHKTLLELPIGNFEHKPKLHHNYIEAIQTGNTIKSLLEIELRGQKLWLDHWIRPFKDSKGNIKGVICGWIDITEHRTLVSQLEEAKNLADEASRAKTQFLATMSHEIRTPMNAVIGILELVLKRAELSDNDRNSIEIAHTSAQSLLDLIGDILDIVRIESGRLNLSLKRANLREQVESVARVFEGLARQKNLALNVDIDTSVNCDVLVDAMRFKQILSNLTSNAIKFTDRGSVSIHINSTRVEPTLLHIHLCVTDTGIGISPQDLEELFQPFVQVNQRSNIREGAGLGLVICRSLCEMMGGSLSMSSEQGKGTRVDVNLRLQTLEEIEEPEPEVQSRNQSARCLKVLVVDDHAVNREILHQQLAYLGHEVVEAENGKQALEKWREQSFDVVITDCRMPGMDGHDLTLAIREEERDDHEDPTLIMGLTADAQPEEIQRCIQAGMNDCLIKPIGLDVLETLLMNVNQPDHKNAHHEKEATTMAQDLTLEPLKKLAGNRTEVFARMVRELIKSNRQDLIALNEEIKIENYAEIAEIAHRIKGAARVVHSDRLFTQCERLESSCRTTPVSKSDVLECIEDIRRETDAQEAYFQAVLAHSIS